MSNSVDTHDCDYVIIYADTDFYIRPITPTEPKEEDDTMDIIVNVLSDIEPVMPTTPNNTPTAIIYDDAMYASILRNEIENFTPSPIPSILQGLSTITSCSSMSITTADELMDALKSLEIIDTPPPPPPPIISNTPHGGMSLTPMLLNGGIPIWFMVGVQLGLIPSPPPP